MVKIKNWDFDNPDYSVFDKDKTSTRKSQVFSWMKFYNRFKNNTPVIQEIINDLRNPRLKNKDVALKFKKKYGININTFRKIKRGYEIVGISPSIKFPTIIRPSKLKKYPHRWSIPFLFNRASGIENKYKPNIYLIEFISAFNYDSVDTNSSIFVNFVLKGVNFIKNDINYTRLIKFSFSIITDQFSGYSSINYISTTKSQFWKIFWNDFQKTLLKLLQSPPINFVGWELIITIK